MKEIIKFLEEKKKALKLEYEEAWEKELEVLAAYYAGKLDMCQELLGWLRGRK